MSGSKASYQRARRAAIKAGTWNPRGASRQKSKENVQVQVSVPTAKTISEAKALAVSLGLADRAEFTNIDIKHVNTLIQQLAEIQKLFPQIGRFEFIGYDKTVFSFTGKKRSNSYAAVVRDFMGNSKFFVLNPKYFSSKNEKSFLEHLQEVYKTGGHPAATVKSVIDHEIGHMLDNLYNFSINNMRIRHIMDTSPHVSTYGARSYSENFAEAWSAYKNIPNPSEAVKSIGDEVMLFAKRK